MDRRNFHVTIKGLFFDERGRILLVREPSGVWDLPGGRLEHGETFHAALRRECREEMALECEILDPAPHWAWSARDRDGLWKVVLCFSDPAREPRVYCVRRVRCSRFLRCVGFRIGIGGTANAAAAALPARAQRVFALRTCTTSAFSPPRL